MRTETCTFNDNTFIDNRWAKNRCVESNISKRSGVQVLIERCSSSLIIQGHFPQLLIPTSSGAGRIVRSTVQYVLKPAN